MRVCVCVCVCVSINIICNVVPGSVGATWDEMHPRAYALEPSQQVDVAFSFGQRTVGVLNLLSRRVTHAYNTNRPDPHADDAHDPQVCVCCVCVGVCVCVY